MLAKSDRDCFEFICSNENGILALALLDKSLWKNNKEDLSQQKELWLD